MNEYEGKPFIWITNDPTLVGKTVKKGPDTITYVNKSLWDSNGLVHCPRCDSMGIEAPAMLFICLHCGNIF